MAIKKTMSSTGNRTAGGINMFSGSSVDYDSYNPNKKTLADSKRYKVKYIKRDLLIDNDKNTFKVGKVDFLMESIEAVGQLQPLVVIPEIDIDDKQTGKYIIRSGSRRKKCLDLLCEKAKRENDQNKYERFNEALVLILPTGATEEEIKRVIVETNTTARQIPPEDLFKNFDFIFKKNEDGTYKYIPEGANKYKVGSDILEEMGFGYTPSSVKDYLNIYTAHNQDIRKYLEKNFLSKRNALIISRFDDDMQDQVMTEIREIEKEDIPKYIKKVVAFLKEEKNKDIKFIRGIDVLKNSTRINKKIKEQINKDLTYIFLNQRQKDECIKELIESKTRLDELIKILDNSYEFEETDLTTEND